MKIHKDNDTIAFEYDALGRRIEKVDAIAQTTTRYYYDEQRVAVQTLVSGGVETDGRYFVFGNYIDEVLVMCRRFGVGWINYYYAHDHLYSPTALFAISGTLLERYEYDAYGTATITGTGPDGLWFTTDDVVRTASQYANPYTFTGRELDTLDAGSRTLMYYRARSYDPETGRFMQRETLDISLELFSSEQQYDDMNSYLYNNNNPVFNTFWAAKTGLKNVFGNDSINIALFYAVQLRFLSLFDSIQGITGCNTETGKPEVEIFIISCNKECTEKHEDVHVKQIRGCCKNYSKCVKNNQGDCYSKWLEYITKNRERFECEAYKKSESCLDKLYKKHKCKECILAPTYCCSLIRKTKFSAQGQKEENCSNKKPSFGCPFTGSGRIK